MELDRRVVLGSQSSDGLPRDRCGRRPGSGDGHGTLPAGEGRAVGGRSGRALRHRDIERAYGETVARINDVFPHWFNPVFKRYGENESELPVDQHMLLSLVAPRPLYVASAIEDRWADPRGEFLSARHAGPVYQLFGEDPLPVEEWPDVGTPVMGTVGYRVRAGGHDVLPYDWERFMDFADKHLRG